MPPLHRRESVFEDSTNGDDEVTLVETGAYEATAHVSCAAEDLDELAFLRSLLSTWCLEVPLNPPPAMESYGDISLVIRNV